MKNKFIKGNVSEFGGSKGWFIGQFMNNYGRPDLTTNDIEVCWKKLEKDFKDPLHFHKKGTEIAIMITGWFSFVVGDEVITLHEREFLVVYPYTPLGVKDYKVGSEMVLIKFPSVPNDKYLTNED